jgi:hypothetical protein
MYLTLNEAESILNLMQASSTEYGSGELAMLTKINDSYPQLLRNNAPFQKILKEQEARKKSAMVQISDLLAQAKLLVAQATTISKECGVGFELYIGDPDQSSHFDPTDGWNSSNC